MSLAWPSETVPGSVSLGDRDDQPTRVALVDRVVKAPVESRVSEQRGAETTENVESQGDVRPPCNNNLYRRRAPAHTHLMVSPPRDPLGKMANIAFAIIPDRVRAIPCTVRASVCFSSARSIPITAPSRGSTAPSRSRRAFRRRSPPVMPLLPFATRTSYGCVWDTKPHYRTRRTSPPQLLSVERAPPGRCPITTPHGRIGNHSPGLARLGGHHYPQPSRHARIVPAKAPGHERDWGFSLSVAVRQFNACSSPHPGR
jgi:hypothetical protein